MGNQYGSVWDFRIDHWDSTGAPQQPVSVEMRGVTFHGSIGDGDWVEIPGRWKPGELLRARSVRNVSQNVIVSAEGNQWRAEGCLGGLTRLVVVLVLIGIFVAVTYLLLNNNFIP